MVFFYISPFSHLKTKHKGVVHYGSLSHFH
nr:MAG TPA: hypothetical protein [Caudoviricetes sp.]